MTSDMGRHGRTCCLRSGACGRWFADLCKVAMRGCEWRAGSKYSPNRELDHAKNSLSVVLGFLGARGAVVISAVFQAFLRDWLWVFVSRGVGMSLADGVTGVVLADGGVAGSEARMRAHWLSLADPIGEYLPPTRTANSPPIGGGGTGGGLWVSRSFAGVMNSVWAVTAW